MAAARRRRLTSSRRDIRSHSTTSSRAGSSRRADSAAAPAAVASSPLASALASAFCAASRSAAVCPNSRRSRSTSPRLSAGPPKEPLPLGSGAVRRPPTGVPTLAPAGEEPRATAKGADALAPKAATGAATGDDKGAGCEAFASTGGGNGASSAAAGEPIGAVVATGGTTGADAAVDAAARGLLALELGPAVEPSSTRSLDERWLDSRRSSGTTPSAKRVVDRRRASDAATCWCFCCSCTSSACRDATTSVSVAARLDSSITCLSFARTSARASPLTRPASRVVSLTSWRALSWHCFSCASDFALALASSSSASARRASNSDTTERSVTVSWETTGDPSGSAAAAVDAPPTATPAAVARGDPVPAVPPDRRVPLPADSDARPLPALVTAAALPSGATPSLRELLRSRRVTKDMMRCWVARSAGDSQRSTRKTPSSGQQRENTFKASMQAASRASFQWSLTHGTCIKCVAPSHSGFDFELEWRCTVHVWRTRGAPNSLSYRRRRGFP